MGIFIQLNFSSYFQGYSVICRFSNISLVRVHCFIYKMLLAFSHKLLSANCSLYLDDEEI